MKANPLERYLDENDESVEEVSKKLDVSESAIYRWLRGETMPSHQSMRSIARLMEKDITSLEMRQIWKQWQRASSEDREEKEKEVQ